MTKIINKQKKGEAVRTLIQYMIDVWEQHGNENLDKIHGILYDAFWTASRITAKYNLKEESLLRAFRDWINANYAIEGFENRI